MKLQDLFEDQEDKVTGQLTDEELGFAYDKLQQHEMSKEEISDWAREMAAEGRYPRSAASLQFVLSRMHIILHGVAPEGEGQHRADVMFKHSQPLIDYVLKRGDLDEEDIAYHIGNAREDLASRPPPQAKLKREDALKLVNQYYVANKDSFPKGTRFDREEMVQSVLNGMNVEEVFSQYI